MKPLDDLIELVGIPSVSAKGYPHEHMARSAAAVADTLSRYRFDNVRILETDGHPAVYGERRGVSGPVTLVYGHHDVQPPGREERWTSPPFRAAIRDGRIYGRGTADDKGGFLAYLAAAASCEVQGTVKVLVEGEEEIGSPNLSSLLRAHRSLFECDYAVLCDTPNFDTGVPSLTYRLRGMSVVDVEVRCTERPIHSGQGGGLVPDATMILCRMLASIDLRLLDERVRIDPAQAEAMRSLPFEVDRVRRNFSLLEDVDLTGQSWEEAWARPSLAVTAFESIPMAQAANQISDGARARLVLRTVAGLDSMEAGQELARMLRQSAPSGVRIAVNVLGGPSWWEADPGHPIYEVGRQALRRAFGREAVMMGSGGSIAFVKPFADLTPRVPPLLVGVQDPHSNAHSENESLHLGDWEKAIAAAGYLLRDLSVYDATVHAG